MGSAAYNRGSRVIRERIDRELAERRTRRVCGGTFRPGPEKRFSRCGKCGVIDYEKYEGDRHA
jgi:hypothetical protein